MSRIMPLHRFLHLRVLALRNVRTGYEPHQDAIARLVHRPLSKLATEARRINSLTWRYRAQISPELVPVTVDPAWLNLVHRTHPQNLCWLSMSRMVTP